MAEGPGLTIFVCGAVIGWATHAHFHPEKNEAPIYGKDSGLPVNCRALVQANIDGFRSGGFNATEVLSSLERNCGANGYLWGTDED